MSFPGVESRKIVHFLLVSSELRHIDSGSWKGPPEGVVQPHHFFFKNYIYLFLVALGLCCCVRAFSSFRGGYSHRGGISCSTAQALEGSLHSRDALG